jgi:hypothetical protein
VCVCVCVCTCVCVCVCACVCVCECVCECECVCFTPVTIHTHTYMYMHTQVPTSFGLFNFFFFFCGMVTCDFCINDATKKSLCQTGTNTCAGESCRLKRLALTERNRQKKRLFPRTRRGRGPYTKRVKSVLEVKHVSTQPGNPEPLPPVDDDVSMKTWPIQTMWILLLVLGIKKYEYKTVGSHFTCTDGWFFTRESDTGGLIRFAFQLGAHPIDKKDENIFRKVSKRDPKRDGIFVNHFGAGKQQFAYQFRNIRYLLNDPPVRANPPNVCSSSSVDTLPGLRPTLLEALKNSILLDGSGISVYHISTLKQELRAEIVDSSRSDYDKHRLLYSLGA